MPGYRVVGGTMFLLALIACDKAEPDLVATPVPTPVPTPTPPATDPPDLMAAEGSWNLTIAPAQTGGTFVGTSPTILLALQAPPGAPASAVVSYEELGRRRSELDATVEIESDGSRLVVSAIEAGEFSVAPFELPLPGLTAELQIQMSLLWPEGFDDVLFSAEAIGAIDLGAGLALDPRGEIFSSNPLLPWTGDFDVFAFESIPGLGAVALTADGLPLGSLTEAEGLPGSPHRARATVDWIPWGSEVSIDTSGLTDLSGNAVSAPPPLTVPVPPEWNGAEDFETGTPPWLGGTVDYVGLSTAPQGVGVGYVARGAFGVGVFTVPSSGGTLRFDASTIGGGIVGCTVTLESEVASTQLYTSPADAGDLCEDCPVGIGTISPFEEVIFDLTGLEGVEVAVRASCPLSFGGPPIPEFGMLLDDFRVE